MYVLIVLWTGLDVISGKNTIDHILYDIYQTVNDACISDEIDMSNI